MNARVSWNFESWENSVSTPGKTKTSQQDIMLDSLDFAKECVGYEDAKEFVHPFDRNRNETKE